jgi:hypothetical protein
MWLVGVKTNIVEIQRFNNTVTGRHRAQRSIEDDCMHDTYHKSNEYEGLTHRKRDGSQKKSKQENQPPKQNGKFGTQDQLEFIKNSINHIV